MHLDTVDTVDDTFDTVDDTVRIAETPGVAPVAGLVVSKAVGGSVVRHRVARRLRHLLATRLPSLPTGTRLVVRAAPAAATATSADLGADLDRALARLVRP